MFPPAGSEAAALRKNQKRWEKARERDYPEIRHPELRRTKAERGREGGDGKRRGF